MIAREEIEIDDEMTAEIEIEIGDGCRAVVMEMAVLAVMEIAVQMGVLAIEIEIAVLAVFHWEIFLEIEIEIEIEIVVSQAEVNEVCLPNDGWIRAVAAIVTAIRSLQMNQIRSLVFHQKLLVVCKTTT